MIGTLSQPLGLGVHDGSAGTDQGSAILDTFKRLTELLEHTRKDMRKHQVNIIISLTMLLTATLAQAKDALAEAVKAIDANVVFMRHAIAPGYGDPEHFSMDDCATQRNLDESGRVQAREVGAQLRTSAIQFAEVLSSEWCRCRDTAQLLNVGPWQPFSGLNSFFQSHADATETLTKLRQRLSSLKPGVTLMVTHQVVISAVTGNSVGSGELIAFNTHTQASRRINFQ